jgi:hypothetical protein
MSTKNAESNPAEDDKGYPPRDKHRYPPFRNPGVVPYVIDRQGPALLP